MWGDFITEGCAGRAAPSIWIHYRDTHRYSADTTVFTNLCCSTDKMKFTAERCDVVLELPMTHSAGICRRDMLHIKPWCEFDFKRKIVLEKCHLLVQSSICCHLGFHYIQTGLFQLQGEIWFIVQMLEWSNATLSSSHDHTDLNANKVKTVNCKCDFVELLPPLTYHIHHTCKCRFSVSLCCFHSPASNSDKTPLDCVKMMIV